MPQSNWATLYSKDTSVPTILHCRNIVLQFVNYLKSCNVEKLQTALFIQRRERFEYTMVFNRSRSYRVSLVKSLELHCFEAIYYHIPFSAVTYTAIVETGKTIDNSAHRISAMRRTERRRTDDSADVYKPGCPLQLSLASHPETAVVRMVLYTFYRFLYE